MENYERAQKKTLWGKFGHFHTTLRDRLGRKPSQREQKALEKKAYESQIRKKLNRKLNRRNRRRDRLAEQEKCRSDLVINENNPNTETHIQYRRTHF